MRSREHVGAVVEGGSGAERAGQPRMPAAQHDHSAAGPPPVGGLGHASGAAWHANVQHSTNHSVTAAHLGRPSLPSSAVSASGSFPSMPIVVAAWYSFRALHISPHVRAAARGTVAVGRLRRQTALTRHPWLLG